MPLIVVVNLDEKELVEQSGKDGTLAGLPADTVMLSPRATDVAKWLARNPEERAVCIAYHPPDASQKCEGDARLPTLEAAWLNNVGGELETLARKPEDRESYEAALERVNAGEIEFIVKCLRHRLPEAHDPRPDQSHVFARLVELAVANHRNDPLALAESREAMVREFREDRHSKREADRSKRRDILALWHRTVADLCVLELELSALSELQHGDEEPAVKYLCELLDDPAYGGFVELEQRAHEGLARLRKYAPAQGDIKLDAMATTLEELREARKRPTRDIGDVKRVAALLDGYTSSVRDLSDAFRDAVAEAPGRAAAATRS